jgi:hypothetical protein
LGAFGQIVRGLRLSVQVIDCLYGGWLFYIVGGSALFIGTWGSAAEMWAIFLIGLPILPLALLSFLSALGASFLQILLSLIAYVMALMVPSVAGISFLPLRSLALGAALLALSIVEEKNKQRQELAI